jgi:uncharacterized protein YkwD
MRKVLSCVAIAVALAGCGLWPSPSPTATVSSSSTGDAAQAAALISAYRAEHGLSPVKVSARLNEAAEHQARTVAGAGQLSHGDFGGRMTQYSVLGTAAENLTAGPRTVQDAVTRWKASPKHNENLLMPEARSIGLARADSSTSYGRYWALVLGQ